MASVKDKHVGIDLVLALPMQGIMMDGGANVIRGGWRRVTNGYEEGHG